MSARYRSLLLTVLLCPTAVLAEPFMNGFDLTGSAVPIEEIHRGGPGRDGIPAIYDPNFAPGGVARNMDPDERVIGVATGGFAKAYPVSILNWHEVVNDRIGRTGYPGHLLPAVRDRDGIRCRPRRAHHDVQRLRSALQ